MSDPSQHHEFSPQHVPAEEVLQPYDARQREGLPPMIKLALVAVGLVLIAFVVLKLYQPGVRDRSDPPRITADNTPFKVPPKEAGGTQTPNQDKVVFEVMDGQSPSTEANPQDPPEDPIKIETAEVVSPDPIEPVVKTPLDETPAPKPSAPEPSVTRTDPPETPAGTVVSSGNSDWVVQVASVRDEAVAGDIWTRVEGKFSNLVSGNYADIKRVDLGDKGIYYRLRVAGLADKSAAQTLCSNFKAGGQDCLVTRK